MKEKINAALDRFYTNSLLAVPVTVLVFYAGWSLIGVLIPSIVPQYALKLVYGLIFSAAILRFRKGHMYPALRNRHGFKVLLWMLPFLLGAAGNFLRSLQTHGSAIFDPQLLLYALVLGVEAGVCEEFMVRGLPLGNALCAKHTRKQYIGLIYYTAFLFGALHLGNLLKGAELVPTLIQVFGAGCMGVFLGALYLRSGSVIPGIICHALWDAALFLNPANLANGGIFPAEKLPAGILDNVTDETAVAVLIVTQLLSAAANLIWVIMAAILLRKSRWPEIKANFEDQAPACLTESKPAEEEGSEPGAPKRSGFRHFLQLPALYLITFVLFFAGELLAEFLLHSTAQIDAFFRSSPAAQTASFYLPFTGIWVVYIAYLLLHKGDRPVLKAIGTKASGNNLRHFLLGLLIGGGFNAVCALAAWLNGDIAPTFGSFRPISFLLIFVCVFIQSSAEELFCRGFLYQKLMQAYKKPIIAIVGNALFFGCIHLGNNGANVLGILNNIVIGIFFSLMVYYMDSIWCPMAAHAAWNFMQNIILGLPNSGNVVPYSVFKLDAANAARSWAYDPGFGIESAVTPLVLTIAACLLLILWGRKHGRKPIDVWTKAETAALYTSE